MISKEDLKKEIDQLSEDSLQMIHLLIQSLKNVTPNDRRIQTFKLRGQFDDIDFRKEAYE